MSDDGGPFRIYVLRRGILDLLSTAETKAGVGVALVTHWGDGEFAMEGDRVGVLYRPSGEKIGKWIVNPFGGDASDPPEEEI